jgi:hypothetical protein
MKLKSETERGKQKEDMNLRSETERGKQMKEHEPQI